MKKTIKKTPCNNINRFKSFAFTLTLSIALILSLSFVSFASSPTDEILNYEITADVLDDASVELTYHLDWEVLESDGIGPVTWVNVGIPNGKGISLEALSDNISSISYDTSSGNNVRIDFDDSYYEGEVISFDFALTTDYMYEMNAQQDGYSVYYFTPGWFDEIAVDKLVLRWNADKADSWSGGALQKDGYLTWTTALDAGDSFSIEVSYPNDAFAFTQYSGSTDYSDYGDGDYYYDDGGSYSYSSGSVIGNIIWRLMSLIFSMGPVLIFVILIIIIKNANKKRYESESGFASGETKTKVTRTKIVYYDSCPGCGAPRKEGTEVCEFCGRSLIKSEEVIKEEEVKDEDKEALKYNKKGEYQYGSDPNTFVRVNVVHIPVVVPHSSFGGPRGGIGGGPRGGSGGGPRRPSGGGGCAHSSCACACVSCACACACACAGGGRAGCSTKDFYSSKLKLKQLKRKTK